MRKNEERQKVRFSLWKRGNAEEEKELRVERAKNFFSRMREIEERIKFLIKILK